LWRSMLEDISLPLFVSSLYVGLSNIVVCMGSTSQGPDMLDGTIQGSILSTSHMLLSLEVVARETIDRLSYRDMRHLMCLGGFGDDVHAGMKGCVVPGLVLLQVFLFVSPLVGLYIQWLKTCLLAPGGVVDDWIAALFMSLGWLPGNVKPYMEILGYWVGFDIPANQPFAKPKGNMVDKPGRGRGALSIQERGMEYVFGVMQRLCAGRRIIVSRLPKIC
jgi:hypothetical protein